MRLGALDDSEDLLEAAASVQLLVQVKLLTRRRPPVVPAPRSGRLRPSRSFCSATSPCAFLPAPGGLVRTSRSCCEPQRRYAQPISGQHPCTRPGPPSPYTLPGSNAVFSSKYRELRAGKISICSAVRQACSSQTPSQGRPMARTHPDPDRHQSSIRMNECPSECPSEWIGAPSEGPIRKDV